MFELIALRHDGSAPSQLHGIPIDGIRRAVREWIDADASESMCIARHIDRAHLVRLRDAMAINGVTAEIRELPKLEPVPPPLTRATPPPTASQSTPRGNVQSDSGLYALKAGSCDAMPFPTSRASNSPVVVRTGVRTGKHGALRTTAPKASVAPTRRPGSSSPSSHRRPAPIRPPSATTSSPIPTPVIASAHDSGQRYARLDEVPPTLREPNYSEATIDRAPSASTSNITNYRALIAEQDLRSESAVHAVVRGVGWVRVRYLVIGVAAFVAYVAYRHFGGA